MVRALYIDSSAAVKLGAAETESPALSDFFGKIASEHGTVHLVSSELIVVEVFRALRRALPDGTMRAREVCNKINTKPINSEMIRFAAFLEPSPLRSLDAIHLATALSLGESIQSVVTYDERMILACGQLGLDATSPGNGD
jgi:predicted nucleic acid-binding protein